MPKLILVSGKKRSGKDFTTNLMAESLRSNGCSVEIKSFAAPMKQIAATIFGISLDRLDELKNEPDSYIDLTHLPTLTTDTTHMRTVLQKLGTEAIKPLFGDNVWAKLMENYLATCTADYVIVPDFRFLVEHIKPSITVRIQCNLADHTDSHASEIELDDFAFDYVLNNDNHQLTQQDLDKFVTMLLESYNA